MFRDLLLTTSYVHNDKTVFILQMHFYLKLSLFLFLFFGYLQQSCIVYVALLLPTGS